MRSSMQDATLNVMVLAALVISIDAVVDDAVVGVENTMRRLRQLRSEGSPVSLQSVVLEGALEVSNTIVYGSLSQVVAVLPLFFMQGLSGAFFRPLAGAYVLVCLYLPVHRADGHAGAGPDLSEERAGRAARIARRGAGSGAAMARRLRGPCTRPAVVYGIVAVIVIAGLVVLPFLGQELLPEFKETGLPDALAGQARHVPPGDVPDHGPGQPRAAGHSRGAQLWRPHRTRRGGRRGGRHVLRRELDQHRSCRRL